MNDGLFFRPFVGSSYADGGLFGKRIMVLGESHYCDEGCADCGDCLRHRECMEFTNGVVKQYLDDRVERQRWMQTLLKFERSLVGRETDQTLRQRIWQSVVFYNYLQVAMGGPREAGTSAQYRQAGEALFCMMEKYRQNISSHGATVCGTSFPASAGPRAGTSSWMAIAWQQGLIPWQAADG